MGAPRGNQNAAKAKRWEAALERAIAAYPAAPDSTGCNGLMRGLNAAAARFVAGMMEKEDLGFFREFADRLDGKPKQQTELTGADGKDLTIMLAEADKTL